MTDLLDKLGIDLLTDFLDHGLLVVAFGTTDANLDQFMVGNGQVDFANDAFSQAILAYQYEGFERVSELS